MVQKTSSATKKEQLANELFKIVERYFRNDGHGYPSPSVSFSQYDILSYTFRVNSRTRDRNVEYVASTGYNPIDLNAFRKEMRDVIKSYGFSKVKFDIKNTKHNYEWWSGMQTDVLKEFIAVYFE